eukprot:3024650-Amphidinium_carterae.1
MRIQNHGAPLLATKTVITQQVTCKSPTARTAEPTTSQSKNLFQQAACCSMSLQKSTETLFSKAHSLPGKA